MVELTHWEMTLAKSICLAMAASGSATGVAAAAGSVLAVVVVVVVVFGRDSCHDGWLSRLSCL